MFNSQVVNSALLRVKGTEQFAEAFASKDAGAEPPWTDPRRAAANCSVSLTISTGLIELDKVPLGDISELVNAALQRTLELMQCSPLRNTL